MPNLVPCTPVEIFLCPPASISGLILIAMGQSFPLDIDISDNFFNSARDSTLNCKIFLSIPKAISSWVFPTPEKTILSGGIPTFKAL